jgi:hypothetical protein
VRRSITLLSVLAALSVALPAAARPAAARPAAASPSTAASLPLELAAWVPWVLDGVPDRNCPVVDGSAICTWPTRLALDLGTTGGTFAFDVTTDREAVVVLPGGTAAWPLSVTSDTGEVAVLQREGLPIVVLPASQHRLKGRFAWRDLPESIVVPPDVALVQLSIAGKPLPFPRREEGGLLWVQPRTEAAQEGESLDLEVSRKITDGIPVRVTTRIVLRASGSPREVDLGQILLAGTVPMAVAADVPARIDATGALRVQVRAGTWNVEVVARTAGDVPETFASPRRESPWPSDETWVFEAADALRQVTVSGAPGVDPTRTGIRDDWRAFPAYLVSAGQSLTIATERRGEPEPPPSSLALSRDVWLDLDGKGYTLRDQIRGRLTRDWRLDLASPAVLGHVAVDGVDQLVTTRPGSGIPGVELRRGDLNLVAESRVDGDTRTLPAVGWSTDVDDLKVRLHLAPGWTLLSASGVDRLPGTWVERWTLLSFLFVLLIALAVARLTRWWWGLLALAGLVLAQHEPGRPWWIWVWVSLLAATALLKVVPDGRFRLAVRLWWAGTLVALALVLIPFTVYEIRTGIHPQVGIGAAQGVDLLSSNDEYEAPNAPAAMDRTLANEVTRAEAEAAEQMEEDKATIELDDEADAVGKARMEPGRPRKGTLADLMPKPQQQAPSGAGSYRAMKKQAMQNDPNAVVQTGPGVPTWSWATSRLDWSGPVDAGHTVRLWLLSPGMNLALALLRVALLLALTWVLVRTGWTIGAPIARTGGPRVPPAAGAATVALLLALLVPGLARSEVPPQDVLDDLRGRLLRPEPCQPDCVSTSVVALTVRGSTLSLRAEIHAGARVQWPVPGPARNWVPGAVTVDGKPDAAMVLLQDGFLHVRLGPGRHVVEATGPTPLVDALTLEFADAPHRVEATATGWDLEGLRDDGRAERSIRLIRRAQIAADGAADGEAAGEAKPEDSSGAGNLPPWLEVTRTLDIGIPWLVHTEVHRASPTGSPVLVRIPLLPGESLTESNLRVEGREVVVSLGRDDTDIGWESTLQEAAKLDLIAPRGVPWSETWVLRCSPVWQCAASGISPVRHQQDGRWEPVFQPYPGESLAVAFERPAGAVGQSVTIDTAQLHWAPGTRLSSAMLVVHVRNSQGGTQTFELPPGAEVQRVAVDGREEAIREEGGRLSVSLHPGRQRIEIGWQQPQGIEPLSRVPRVGLGAPAANTQVVVTLPEERWLLLAGGPSWGPAVLFWGLLIAAILAALLLGRLSLSPLRTWQWMLLAAGLTQIPVWASLVVAAWFLALQWRGTRPQPNRPVLRDAVQIGLAVGTVVALGCLYAAVHAGLLLQPDMQVAGAGSSQGQLVWFADRVGATLPQPWVLSLPRRVWQGILLAWSLWLAWSLVKWMPWAWRCWSTGGIWSRIRKEKRPAGVVPTPPAE